MKPFREVIDGIRKAVMASEVREDLAQMGEYVEQFANTAGENIQKAIDPTLSLSGKAADAAKVGEAVGQLKEDLSDYYFETINEPLFTKKDTVINGYVGRGNGIIISADTTSKSVYQAKLKSGETKITFGFGRCFAFYDENKTYIKNEGILNESGSVTIDIPTNAIYISYSWRIETQEKFVAVYGEATEPLYQIGVPTTLEKRVYNLENRTELIKADEVSFLSVGENLFNKSTETQDAYLNKGEIELNNSGYVGYCVSDYIKVKANTNYISNKNIIRYCLYDKDKKYVTQNSSNQTVITPTVDGYIRLTYYSPTSDKHNSNELMFIIGDTVPTEYKAYCFYPNSTDEYPLDFNKTWWKDKLICTFGDSNTANQRWQQYMNAQLGCTHQNCGIGGTSMSGDNENAMWQDARINTIDDNAKAILIMAGTNDGAGSRKIGTMSTDNEDTNTFVGAYNTCIKKIYTKMGITFPIFLFTPIPCFNITTYPRVKEMANAIKEIGAMWSLPVIDAQNECGINVANRESLYASDGVHIDYEGGKMLASLVVGILKAHEPID